MGFRRSKSDVRAARKWSDFVARNKPLIELAALSLAIVADERHWLYFLEHGTLFPEDDFYKSRIPRRRLCENLQGEMR